MGGDSGTIIVRKNLKAAMQLSLTPSGKFKVWHALSLTHALAVALGAWLF